MNWKNELKLKWNSKKKEKYEQGGILSEFMLDIRYFLSNKYKVDEIIIQNYIDEKYIRVV